MKVLVVGSGGREHCLAWKIKQSSLVDKVYCAPGNGGTSLAAQNVDILADDLMGLLDFVKKNKIDLTVVGPEVPLVLGIVDLFEKENLKIFGPRKALALLEGSKVFAKEVMLKYGIPTADFKVFSQADLAKTYIREHNVPIVIKADGLAQGKGVFVCQTKDEANQALDLIFKERVFGDAGNNVIIEDCLVGEEASILIFTDGKTVIPLVSAQDHKRIGENDNGLNTGGMGAYSPAPIVTKEIEKKVLDTVCYPLIKGLNKEGLVYQGILYVGLMLVNGKPYVLEFNVRFGDPETQVVLPKLKSDLVRIMQKTINQELDGFCLEWDNRPCITVVLAAGGYPGEYEKGKEILGLEKLENEEDLVVFHAGTKVVENRIITNGGRVLNLVALGDTLLAARQKVYQAINFIEFENKYYRKDIAYKALSYV